MHKLSFWGAPSLVVCVVNVAGAQARGHADHELGKVDFVVSCSDTVRAEFNRAVALLHHMTYPAAREAFQNVTRSDPRCAMAHWGIAMTLFQPLWPTRPSLAERRRGWEEAQTAARLAPPTERERLFVDAAAAFFSDPDSVDYWPRIRRWEAAMQRVHDEAPNDAEASAFYALSLLAVAPAGAVSNENAGKAADLLLDIYARNPDHPGAMHYLVHANDTPGREHEKMEIIRKYETSAPRNPHALHMPTHIYTRLGDWDAVIRGNTRAAQAALEIPAGDSGQYVWDEFPHAVEYLVYAYLQEGDDAHALAEVNRLWATARLQPSFKTAFHLASTKARYALERHDWKEAAALMPRQPSTLDWDKFWWSEAVTWFARGLGTAHQRNLDEARAAAARLQALEAAAQNAKEDLFARNIHILGLEVRAWIAHAEHDDASSIATMREAAELEVSTPKHAVTPAPTIPAYELLGDVLMEQSKASDALAAYKRSLDLYPRRLNSLLGAARAAKAGGNEPLARAYYRDVIAVGSKATRASVVREARAFVGRNR